MRKRYYTTHNNCSMKRRKNCEIIFSVEQSFKSSTCTNIAFDSQRKLN